MYITTEDALKNGMCIVSLPDYVKSFATEFTVHLTPFANDSGEDPGYLWSSRVQEGKFIAYGKRDCQFFWCVYGKRNNIVVEPNCKDVQVHGNGPYRWLEKS